MEDSNWRFDLMVVTAGTSSGAGFVLFRIEVFVAELAGHTTLPTPVDIEAVQGTSFVLQAEKTDRKQAERSACKAPESNSAKQFCRTVTGLEHVRIVADRTDWLVHTALVDLEEEDSVHKARDSNMRFQLVHMELTTFARAAVDYIADSTFCHIHSHAFAREGKNMDQSNRPHTFHTDPDGASSDFQALQEQHSFRFDCGRRSSPVAGHSQVVHRSQIAVFAEATAVGATVSVLLGRKAY